MEVFIRIKSTIRYVHNDVETVDQAYIGQFYEKEHANYIRYTEEEEQGNTSTIIRWNLDHPLNITIIRQGVRKVQQLFQQQWRDDASYITPNGKFTLTTETAEVDWNMISNKNGKLYMNYQVFLDDHKIGDYETTILYEEIRDKNV